MTKFEHDVTISNLELVIEELYGMDGKKKDA